MGPHYVIKLPEEIAWFVGVPIPHKEAQQK